MSFEQKDNRIATAVRIAAQVHERQTDKADVPYIFHALAVKDLVDTSGLKDNPAMYEALICAAILHDVIEDFEGSPADKLKLRDEIYQIFGARCYQAIDALTRLDDDDYLGDYIERVAGDWIARRVKIADLTHNMDPRRIPAREIRDKDFERWDRYRRALVRLEREE